MCDSGCERLTVETVTTSCWNCYRLLASTNCQSRWQDGNEL